MRRRFEATGPEAVAAAILAARHDLVLTLPHPGLLGDRSAVDVAAAARVASRGVPVRALVTRAGRGPGDGRSAAAPDLSRPGFAVRTTPDALPRMSFVDRGLILIATSDAGYDEGSLIGVDRPLACRLLGVLGMPGGAEPGTEAPPAVDLQPLEREVLRRLATGSTDEVAARELGVALRTYRRVVARTMARLGARSRFQAGYLAASGRWI
jgi:DNA-binding CsgD family transcriptional regulator